MDNLAGYIIAAVLLGSVAFIFVAWTYAAFVAFLTTMANVCYWLEQKLRR